MDRVLVIDDDEEMCGMLDEYLRSEGFAVETVHNGEDGLTRALSGEHSVIVLDVMLPGMNGIEVLRRLRSESDARVLMLTARGEEVDKIVGFEVGADDYVPKPFSPRELLVRIRAILRRPGSNGKPERIVLDDLELNTGNRSLKQGGQGSGAYRAGVQPFGIAVADGRAGCNARAGGQTCSGAAVFGVGSQHRRARQQTSAEAW
jgi:DNA-binding response OmpR family regulator